MKGVYPQHCFAQVNKERGILFAHIQKLLAKIEQHPELWRLNTERQNTPGSAHHDTDCIYIVGPREMTLESVFNDLEGETYPALDYLLHEVTQLTGMAQAFAASWDQPQQREPKLGRVMIVNLHQGGAIDEHLDEGAYADHFDRFHLVLSARPGVKFHVGPYHFECEVGQLWWFNHKLPHRVVNESDDDRLHLIVDMVSPYWRMERNKGLAAARGSIQVNR
jgi:hypothetical protein